MSNWPPWGTNESFLTCSERNRGARLHVVSATSSKKTCASFWQVTGDCLSAGVRAEGRLLGRPGCAPPFDSRQRGQHPERRIRKRTDGFLCSSFIFCEIRQIRRQPCGGNSSCAPPREIVIGGMWWAPTQGPSTVLIGGWRVGGCGDSENGGHKSPPPSRLLKPSAKFHFEPVKQTGSITER